MLLVLLTACNQSQRPSFRSTDITGADFGKDFLLADFNGRERRIEDFRGKIVALFFGYTHCPDVCPTTLSDLASARRMLGAEADRLQVIFVTADPERDTPDVLKQYVTAFDPTFLGLRGTPEQTAQTAKAFKVVIQKSPGADASSYSVDHSSGTYVYDTRGRLRLYMSYGQTAELFAHDIALLLKSES